MKGIEFTTKLSLKLNNQIDDNNNSTDTMTTK